MENAEIIQPVAQSAAAMALAAAAHLEAEKADHAAKEHSAEQLAAERAAWLAEDRLQTLASMASLERADSAAGAWIQLALAYAAVEEMQGLLRRYIERDLAKMEESGSEAWIGDPLHDALTAKRAEINAQHRRIERCLYSIADYVRRQPGADAVREEVQAWMPDFQSPFAGLTRP